MKPDALAAFPLIVTMEGCRYREYLDALLQEAPVQPCIRGVADSVPALVQMVSAGLGVSILPRMAVDTAETASRVELHALSTIGEGLPICLLTMGREPASCGSIYRNGPSRRGKLRRAGVRPRREEPCRSCSRHQVGRQ